MGNKQVSRNKQARREGVDLGLKTFGSKAHGSLLKRLNVVPGFQPTRKLMSKLSDYGRQLREKQKLKKIYNVSENTMRRYFAKASRMKGNSAAFLVQFLETRLDNVLYRLRLAPTRSAARQLVTHGHITINGKKVTIPSYAVQKDDKIAFAKEKTAEIPYIKQMVEEKNITLPQWLKRGKQNGEVTALPIIDDYTEPASLSLVIEFYSKI